MKKIKTNEDGNIVSSPIKILDRNKFNTGTVYKMSNGSFIVIERYINKFTVHIRFLDESNYRTIANIDNIRAGNVKNPYERNKYGGYLGEGIFDSVLYKSVYKAWEGILKRVSGYDHKAYDCCMIDDKWLNYQMFAKWYVEYLSILNPNEKYQVDKDIFQWNIDHKIYSENTCCLIPAKLNSSLVGLHVERLNHPDLPLSVMPNHNKFSSYIVENEHRVYLGSFDTPMEAFLVYKKRKENNIVQLASFYYNNNCIRKDVYEAILNIDIQPF